MSFEVEKWRLSVLSPESSLRDAVNSLNHSGLRIGLIAEADNRLIGTISDGDIRRGFLAGLSLDESILDVYNPNPITCRVFDDFEKAHALMLQHNLQQIPIVDSDGKLCGLHTWSEFPMRPRIQNKMVVMAGGKGTRLHPQTKTCPKPMLEVNGMPILEHIVRRAINSGIENYVFSINYLGEQIEKYFGNGNSFGINISYIKETEPLGTAGSLRLLELDDSEPLLVTNGDVLTDLDYSSLLEFHKSQETVLSVAVRTFEWQNPFGVMDIQNSRVSSYREKPVVNSFINAGVYVINPSVVQHFPSENRFDMSDLISKLIEDEIEISAYPIHENWLDVGNRESLARAMGSPATNKAEKNV